MPRLLPSDRSMRALVSGFLAVCLFAGKVTGSDSGGGLGSPPPGPGLVGTYTDGTRTIVVVADTPNFCLQPEESIHPALGPAFEAEWTGFISILEGGRYEFRSGRSAIEVAGHRLTVEPIALDSGLYPVRVSYRRAPGAAHLELRWKSDHFAEEPVPSSVFLHYGESDELRAQMVVERGRFLIEEYGCINCHFTRSSSLVARRGPDLSRIGSRVGPRWIYRWLAAPRRFRPGAAMPALLDAKGRRDVAFYLQSLRGNKPRESRAITPHEVGKGQDLYESIGCHACHDLPELSLAGMGSKTSRTALADYLLDPVRIDPGGRMPSLELTEEEARQLAAFLVQSRSAAFEEEIPNASEADPEEGKRLVRARGCLECHELEPPEEAEPLISTFGAPPLERLGTTGGCLAIEPRPGTPRYDLSAEERSALGAFIASFRDAPDVSAAPVHATERRVRQLRCTACHQRDARGPDVPILDRVPTLTGVGAKLRSTWIDAVLTKGRRIRPELRLRMPQFPAILVKPLAAGLAAMDGLPPVEARTRRGDGEAAMTARQAAGVDLIGSDGARGGLSCLACHDHGSHRPIADEKGPQMIDAAERLRFDWFRRWMYNPGRIVSGTSMPTYFSGLSMREADERIGELWAALEMGEDMPRPYGVGLETLTSGDEAFPTPTLAAVVVRFPLPGATAAAIAVGLPRQGKIPGISYCFDAAVCRLVFAWQGGFLDLSGSLGKKMEYPRLLGEIFYRTTRFPFRIGDRDRIPAARFRGYRIASGLPEFRYESDGFDIRERVVPVRSGSGFVQEFRIDRVDRPMWFVVDETETLEWTSTVGELRRERDGRRRTLAIPRGEDVRFDVRVIRRDLTEPDEGAAK